MLRHPVLEHLLLSPLSYTSVLTHDSTILSTFSTFQNTLFSYSFPIFARIISIKGQPIVLNPLFTE